MAGQSWWESVKEAAESAVESAAVLVGYADQETVDQNNAMEEKYHVGDSYETVRDILQDKDETSTIDDSLKAILGGEGQELSDAQALQKLDEMTGSQAAMDNLAALLQNREFEEALATIAGDSDLKEEFQKMLQPSNGEEGQASVLETMSAAEIIAKMNKGIDADKVNDQMAAEHGAAYTDVRDILKDNPTLVSAIQTLQGGDGSGSLEEGLQELDALEAANPGFLDKLGTLLADSDVRASLKQIAGNEKLVERIQEMEGGQDFTDMIMNSSPEEIKTMLNEVKEAGAALDNVSGMAGFAKFEQLMEDKPELAGALGALTGGGDLNDPLAMAGAVQELEEIATASGNDNFFNDLTDVLEAPGAADFLQTAAASPGLQSFLQDLTGAGGEAGLSGDALESVKGLISEDNEIFEKLNDLAGNEGFNSLMTQVASHEGFQDLFSGSTDDPSQAAVFIEGIHQRVESDPSYLQKVSDLIEDNPGLITTAAGMGAGSLLDDPNKALGMLDMAVNLDQKIGGIMSALMDKMQPIMDGLMQAIGPLLDKFMDMLGPMIEGFTDMIGGLVDNFNNSNDLDGTSSDPNRPVLADVKPETQPGATQPGVEPMAMNNTNQHNPHNDGVVPEYSPNSNDTLTA
jgi:hypothetical protein